MGEESNSTYYIPGGSAVLDTFSMEIEVMYKCLEPFHGYLIQLQTAGGHLVPYFWRSIAGGFAMLHANC